MKVTLGVLLSHGFPVPAPFVIGYSLLQHALITGEFNNLLPPDRRIDRSRVLWGQDFPIDHARNRMVRLFLDNDDGDYLLFLDADMGHPPDLPFRLVKHGVDVVTARYTLRKQPFWTVAMRRVGPGPGEYAAIEKVEPVVRGLMPIDAGGAGCLLISRRCLVAMRERQAERANFRRDFLTEMMRDLERGHENDATENFRDLFHAEMNPLPGIGYGDDWFRYQDGRDGLRSVSEDMWFYEQAKATGFQPFLDADTVCTHVAQFQVDPDWNQPFKDLFHAELEKVAASAHAGGSAA